MRNIVILALLTLCQLALPAATVFSSSTEVKSLKDNFSINGKMKWLSGTDDPSSVAKDAPAGSIYTETDTGRIFRKTDAGSSVNWVILNSGSSSGINYIAPNHDAEAGTTGWATFADAASATGPVDGTGGTANFTWTASATTPLRDLNSFVLTKDAANRQGQGVSYTFTVPSADFAKVHTIGFTYNTSTNYVNQDVQVWIYDVTNSVLIQPSNYKLDGAPSTGPPQKYQASFQSSAAGTSYRLILYTAGTTATAWTLKADDFTVGPQSLVYASPVTDWQTYTPVITNAGTCTGVAGWWRRVGDSMEIRGEATAGTVTANPLLISLPSGYSHNYSANAIETGTWGTSYTGGNATARPLINIARPTQISWGSNNAASVFVEANANGLTTNTSTFGWTARVRILGWGSSLQTSDQADGRVVAARYTTTVGTAFGNGVYSAAFPYATKAIDTHGAMNGTTGVYTCPVAGIYRVTAAFKSAAYAGVADRAIKLAVYKNGVIESVVASGMAQHTTSSKKVAAGSVLVECLAGGTLDLRGYCDDSAVVLDGNADSNYFSVERLSGPAAIASSETVTARYTTAAGQSIPDATFTIVDFGTKDYDSHGSVTTGASWKFTAQSAGKYRVMTNNLFTSGGGWGVGEVTEMSLYKNGSTVQTLSTEREKVAHTTFVRVSGHGEINLLAGDYIDFRIYQGSGAALALHSAAASNYVTITKVAN